MQMQCLEIYKKSDALHLQIVQRTQKDWKKLRFT